VKTLAACLFLLGCVQGFAGEPAVAQTPVIDFRLPTFTKEGYRSMLLQGSKAIVGPNRIDLVNLNLNLFTGDAQSTVETIILSPAASADPQTETVQGPGPVRVIRDDLEITGQGWFYDHRQKKVSITSHARVVFHASLPDILK
jgi:hypothetical protein